MAEPIWCIMPVLAAPDLTEAAVSDILGQSVPTRLLVVNQGVDDAFRERLERLAEQDERIFLWHHVPPLPSLSSTWNTALNFVWSTPGAEVALVVNNDVRLLPRTVEILAEALHLTDALFVSAVGVDEAGFKEAEEVKDLQPILSGPGRGGPDFSCFLISLACHIPFRFDEHFVPAFCEDLDYHRRLMLAGAGQRIFSINVPYLHYASQTLKTLPQKAADDVRRRIEQGSRAYYAKKWGGPVNQETYWAPFDLVEDYPNKIYLSHLVDPRTTTLFDYERRYWSGQDARATEPAGRPDPSFDVDPRD